MEFLAKCNYKGKYFDRFVPDLFKFREDKKDAKRYKICMKYRNRPEWYEKCSFMCEKFNAVKFDSFYVPHLKGYINFIKYTNVKMFKIDKDMKMYMRIRPKIIRPKPIGTRIL